MPDVSVIVPVYNMRAYLSDCLESLLSQQLEGYTLEVIAIDDGSTDGSEALLDEFADRDSRLRVIHQANSGWPGQPRNRGIDASNGRYIFFCDADDMVPEQSLRRLVHFADANTADVVIPKIVGGNGRWIRKRLYERTEVDADLFKAFQTHGPQKLFRRSLIIENKIRFPEHKMRLEDAKFGFQCYTVARRVSILADYDYYILQNRHDGSNISRSGLDPVSYTRDSIDVARVVHRGLPNGDLRDRIMTELYRRICLRRYAGSSFANASQLTQDAWIRGHQAFISEFIPRSLDLLLDSVQRQRSTLVRQGRRDDLVLLSASTSEDNLLAEMSNISTLQGTCELSGRVSMENQFQIFNWGVVELRRRGHGEVIVFNVFPDQLHVSPGTNADAPKFVEFRVQFDKEILKRYKHGTYDILFRTSFGGKRVEGRMTAPAGDAIVEYPGSDVVRFYSTRHGNLSGIIYSAGESAAAPSDVGTRQVLSVDDEL